MFKSIKNLALAYFRENWLIDIIILIVFALFISIYYLIFNDYGLEKNRELAVKIWIIATFMYTSSNAFNAYGDLRKSYFKLLLPASMLSKFLWEWFRTLILFGGLSLGLLFAVDAGFERLALHLCLECTECIENINTTPSLADTLFIKNEPLNYLPIMVYLVVFWHSIALLARTGMNKIATYLLLIAGWVLMQFMPISDDNSSLLYPFISQQEQWDFFRIQLSWSSRSVEYLLSYIWLWALPIALYLLSYFRIKEREI